jgi:cell division protein FtsB
LGPLFDSDAPRQPPRGGFWLLGLLLLVLFLVGTPYYLAVSAAAERREDLRGEIEGVRQTNARVAEENDALRRQVGLLREPKSLVKVARDDLGMVRPGEVVFFVAP